MSKIIIQNDTNLPDKQVFSYVLQIMGMGRISNNNTQYCYHTSFTNGIEVSSFLNKKSDKFVIYKDAK